MMNLPSGNLTMYPSPICEGVWVMPAPVELEKLCGRVRCLHIHDNDGVSDSHCIPFECPESTPLGGCVDWEDAAEGLRLSDFLATSNRCINLELKSSDLPADRSVRLSHAARAVYAAKRLATLM